MDLLPTEILLRIFENLKYIDLKLTVPLICRKFKAILGPESKAAFGAVDRRLFRDKPVAFPASNRPRRISKRDYDVHPALSSLDFTFTSPADTEVILNFRRASDGTLSPVDLKPVWSENAVSPAVETIVVRATYFEAREIQAKNPTEGSAVTVGDVMAHILAAFERGMLEEPAGGNTARYKNVLEGLRSVGFRRPGVVIGWQKVEAVDSPDGHVRLCVVRLNTTES